MKVTSGLLATVLVVLGLAAATAQTPRGTGTDPYEVTSRLSEAMRFVSTDPDRALKILRELDGMFPQNDRVLNRIGYVHQVLGEPDSAAYFFKQALSVNPASVEAGRSLGTLFMSQDRDQEALDVFNQLLERNNYSVGAYRAVGTSLRDLGRFDAAVDIYRDGRQRSDAHQMLSLEIANTLAAAGKPVDALDEYFDYVAVRSRNYRFTRQKMVDLIHDAGADRERVVESLKRKLDDSSADNYVVHDLLAAHYLDQGLLEPALESALSADRAGTTDGQSLVQLADQLLLRADTRPKAERTRYLELGVRALDAYTSSHASATGADRAKFLLGNICSELGTRADIPASGLGRDRYLDRALETYTALSRFHPNSEYAELANLRLGELLLHARKDPQAALNAYKTGAVNSRRHGDRFGARIAEVYIGSDRLSEADDYLRQLLGSNVVELIQTGTYYSGVLEAVRGNFTTARDTLTYLAEADPSSPYTNDAIEHAWIIEEALQYDSKALPTFVGAWQAEMIGDTTKVVAALREILKGPTYDPMRPRAVIKLSDALHQRGQHSEAVTLLKGFLNDYPESRLRPDVQRKIAFVYERGMERYKAALREYESVLMNYPDYAFMDEVRDDVRRLRFLVDGEEIP